MDDDGCSTEKQQEPLAEMLQTINQLFRQGSDAIDQFTLRELLARILTLAKNGKPTLKNLYMEYEKQWPKWTRHTGAQANMLSIARTNGDTRSFVLLYMDLQTQPPESDVLPLQAWTVFNTWLQEDGLMAGAKLPNWVWNYLTTTAWNIQKLRANAIMPDADCADLVAAVPTALGFSGNRQNIFKDDKAAYLQETAALIYDANGHRGLKGTTRIDDVRCLLGLTDDRTARRYVAKGRSRMPAKRLPPWAK